MANEVTIVVTSEDKTKGGFSSAERRAGGLKDKLATVGKVGGAALAAGVVAGAMVVKDQMDQSVEAASNLGESVNAVNQIFGSQAGTIKKWGEQNAASFGLSTRAFNELATPLGAGLKNAGMSLQDTSKWTIDLTKRASDMASVFNTDVDTALEAIQSGLRGEADPLERFGVGLSAAKVESKALAMTGKDVASSLTDQEKMQARLALIMEQTNATAGDFRNTSDGLANSQRIAAAETENLQAEIGQRLLPMTLRANQAKLALIKTIGENLVPALDKLIARWGPVASEIGAKVLPALQALGTWIQDNVIPIIVQLYGFALKNAQAGFKAIESAVRDNKPELQALAKFLGQVATVIRTQVLPVVGPIITGYFRAWATAISIVIRAIGLLVRIVQTFAAAGRTTVSIVRQAWQGFQSFITGMPGRVRGALSRLFNPIKDAASSAVRWVKDKLNGLVSWVQGIPGRIRRSVTGSIDSIVADARNRLSFIPGLAHGGIVGAQGGGPRSNLTMVGEHGRELVRLAPGSQVHSNPDTERMLAGRGSGAGGAMHIVLEIPGIGKLDIDLLNKTIQTNRGVRASIRQVTA